VRSAALAIPNCHCVYSLFESGSKWWESGCMARPKGGRGDDPAGGISVAVKGKGRCKLRNDSNALPLLTPYIPLWTSGFGWRPTGPNLVQTMSSSPGPIYVPEIENATRVGRRPIQSCACTSANGTKVGRCGCKPPPSRLSSATGRRELGAIAGFNSLDDRDIENESHSESEKLQNATHQYDNTRSR
jgi:hypothetical protein